MNSISFYVTILLYFDFKDQKIVARAEGQQCRRMVLQDPEIKVKSLLLSCQLRIF